MSKGRVCVIGSINMDLVIRAPHLPQVGETVLGGPFDTFPGGKGANQAVAAARMNAHVTMIGQVGEDAYGQQLRTILQTALIDLSQVRTNTDVATGVAIILVEDHTGENMIVVAGGANRSIIRDDVDNAASAIHSADVVLMQLEIPVDAAMHAAELARARGIPIVLNAAPATKLDNEFLALIDVLIVNEGEGSFLAECDASQQPDEIAAQLLAKGPRSVVMTLGAQGAIVAQNQAIDRVSALQVRAVDTVGAGDAFCGALAARLAAGHDLIDAAQMGAIAGSLAATRAGAMPSLPRYEEVERARAQSSK